MDPQVGPASQLGCGLFTVGHLRVEVGCFLLHLDICFRHELGFRSRKFIQKE